MKIRYIIFNITIIIRRKFFFPFVMNKMLRFVFQTLLPRQVI